ncbi:PspC domain-containing protein [Nesterenkonia populi]|uniref:PspC domain-containing protein n=1 Tax=Nesterenkonia populi TaxID=1591087 RepID=UPI00147845B9|nr:PspC domain-containing protein [Nesterenkonia populi]
MDDKQHDGRREAGHQIFDWVRSTGARRPSNGWAGGVFAALGEKLGWDSTLVRGLGVLAFILVAAPTALLYGLAWLFLPDQEGRIHLQRALRGDFSSGAIGGGLLAGFGALNVFTPATAGPFQFVVNVVVLGVVGWVVYLLMRNFSRGSREERPSGDGRSGGGREEAQPARDDGRPAWYPKEGAERVPAASPTAADAHGEHTYTYSPETGTAPAPARHARAQRGAAADPDPAEREERRRRRMVTFGLLLLAAPAFGIAMLLGSALGFTATGAVLTVLAGLVALLALMHIGSGLRGRRGRTGLLASLTAVMLALAFGHSGGGATHVFGNYATSSEEVNTAFANTTVDLTDPSSYAGTDEGYAHHAEVNGGFGSVDVVVPDDAEVTVTASHAFSKLEFRTETFSEERVGIGTEERSFGPADEAGHVAGQIEISVNQAFGSVTVYDAATYEEEG